MKKKTSNHNVKVEKMVVFVKAFEYYYHKFNFDSLKLKFKPKFNHGFTMVMAIYNVLFDKLYTILTLFTMGLFSWGFIRIGGGAEKDPLRKIRLTYPTMITFGTIIPYLKKIQKIYKSRDTPLEFY